MMETEYLDAKRFPLSTQKGLTLGQQKMIDAVNFDDLLALLDRGETLTPAQQAVGRELEEKLARRLEARDTRSALDKLLES